MEREGGSLSTLARKGKERRRIFNSKKKLCLGRPIVRPRIAKFFSGKKERRRDFNLNGLQKSYARHQGERRKGQAGGEQRKCTACGSKRERGLN